MPNAVLLSMQEGLEEPVWFSRAKQFVEKSMAALRYDGQEVSVLFCNDSFIQELNHTYRNIDSPTDVLSFENGASYTDEDGNEWTNIGDIVISLETLPKNAAYFGGTEDAELKRLLVHGLLHLNGLDHGDEHIEAGKEPECEMLVIQEKLLVELAQEHIM